ncbi:UNVERIFIED_CONTAM: transcriptional regulator [Methylobacteriaceae bacterium AG10]|uniref:Transcriptional regulator n=1 Tax=Methylorubrum podarium TaxID=200476 RepID=A0ABV1QUD0_9HYPH|nr:transcriptional regulator [Methylobacteriaceae bacterium AG10]
MKDVTDDVFADIVSGLEQAAAHARGEADLQLTVPDSVSVDVVAIRKRTGKSQPAFARSIGVPVGTLRQWEAHRRQPRGAALVLLALLEKNPRLVEETLSRG